MQIGLFIGRFNPIHYGHIETIKQMLSENDAIILAIGSHESAFSPNKILTSTETTTLIEYALLSFMTLNEIKNRVSFIYLYDNLYNDLAWATNVRYQVRNIIRSIYCSNDNFRVNLYGYNKDFTSKYLNWFPHYNLIESKPFKLYDNIINDTDIRNFVFENVNINDFNSIYLSDFMPTVVLNELTHIINNNKNRFLEIKDEYNTYKKYKDAWTNAPYPPVFVTGDAVVFCNGHVLVIKRKFNPGKSLMALPGGFINQNETIKECILRELKEETKINVPPNKLSNSVRAIETFDAPNRSLRGRTITHAGVILLRDESCLPRVTAADDAISASWLPIEYLDTKRSEFFEDHYHIIKNLLKYYQEV